MPGLALTVERGVHLLPDIFPQLLHILAATPGIQVQHAGQWFGKDLLEIIR
jgi:hypothetical protein